MLFLYCYELWGDKSELSLFYIFVMYSDLIFASTEPQPQPQSQAKIQEVCISVVSLPCLALQFIKFVRENIEMKWCDHDDDDGSCMNGTEHKRYIFHNGK